MNEIHIEYVNKTRDNVVSELVIEKFSPYRKDEEKLSTEYSALHRVRINLRL